MAALCAGASIGLTTTAKRIHRNGGEDAEWPPFSLPSFKSRTAFVIVLLTSMSLDLLTQKSTSILPPDMYHRYPESGFGAEGIATNREGRTFSPTTFGDFLLVFNYFIVGALAVPPPSCAGPTTIAGPRTILLDPADTGGYTVLYSACTVTGSLMIDSTAAGVAHVNAVVDIQNSTAATFTIAAGVLLGAGSRIRIKGLTGITAATLAGSAQDGAELLFSFVTLSTASVGGLVIAGTYAAQSLLLLDVCSIKTSTSAAITVNNAVIGSGSRFNITNSVVESTAAMGLHWIGSSAASSTPVGLFPTTVVALSNTTFRGRNAFFMASTAPGIQSGALLQISGGCTFAVTLTTESLMSLQLKGGLVSLDTPQKPLTGTSTVGGRILVYLTAIDAGGHFFAVRGANAGTIGWYRTAGLPSRNETIILEDSTGVTAALEVGDAIGLNLTLRRFILTGAYTMPSTHTLTNSSVAVVDSAVTQLNQYAPAIRSFISVLRSNLSITQLNFPATDCPLLSIAQVRASQLFVYSARLRSPVVIVDVVLTNAVHISGTHTDSVIHFLRCAMPHLSLSLGSALVRTPLLLHHSVVSGGIFQQAVRLENTWDAAMLELLDTSVTTGQLFSVFIYNPPLNGSRHRFVESALTSTTTTYPASGTEPLQGVLVYASGFGSGGLLEVRGTVLNARHISTYLVFAEVSGSRVFVEGADAGSGRLHVKTLTGGSAGDIVRILNASVNAVTIALANGTDCEVTVANSTITEAFSLELAGQTRFVHRMLNTTVIGALTVASSGVLTDSGVLLHQLQAHRVTHSAVALVGGCFVVLESTITSSIAFVASFTLAAALSGLEAHFSNNTLLGLLTLDGPHSNVTLIIDKNTMLDGNLIVTAYASSNVTWRIQHNNMTGGHGIRIESLTTVASGIVAIVNNTLGPHHGVWFRGAVGSGATLWMRNNTIHSLPGFVGFFFSLSVRITGGGRLDHDGSNTYSGGGDIISISIEGPDAGNNFFVLNRSTVNIFKWIRTAGFSTFNETILLLKSVISSATSQISQQTCVDCYIIADQCTFTSGGFSIDGTRSSTTALMVPPPSDPALALVCSVCFISCHVTGLLQIAGSFSGLSSTLQLLNSTFVNGVMVAASFTAVAVTTNTSTGNATVTPTTNVTRIVSTDVYNCSFYYGSLRFVGALSVNSPGTAAMAVIQVRDTRFELTVADPALEIMGPVFGGNSNGSLFIQNVLCITPDSSVRCVVVTSLGAAAWFEIWNSTFINGALSITATSAATNVVLVGNRVPSVSVVVGAVAAVSGGRVAACNQDSSTVGWPPLAIGGTVGFINLSCVPSQMVTRCGPAWGSLASVTDGGSVPPCLSAYPTGAMVVVDLPAVLLAASRPSVALPPMRSPCSPDRRQPISAFTRSNSIGSPTRSWTAPRDASVSPPWTWSNDPTNHSMTTSPTPSPASTLTHGNESSTHIRIGSQSRTSSQPLTRLSPSSSALTSVSAGLPPTASPMSTLTTSAPTVTLNGPPATHTHSITSTINVPPPATNTTAIVTTTTTTTTSSTTPPSAPSTTCLAPEAKTTSAVIELPLLAVTGPLIARGSVSFPIPDMTRLGNLTAALTPVWHATAGAEALATWFIVNVAPHATCTVDAAEVSLVCRLPRSPPPGDIQTDAVAATVEAIVQTGPCPATPLHLVLSLVRPSPAASAATIVVFTAALVGTTTYTLVVEPWAVEPLVLAGILDGPCAPPAVRDTARIAIYALNPFAALGAALAGPLLAVLVLTVMVGNVVAAAATAHRRREGECSGWQRVVGQGLFPRLSFAVAVAALPGVAWAAAATIREGPLGGPLAAVLLCAAYVVAVPCIGAWVVIRLAPARFVPRRIAPAEALWRRVVWPSGRWTPLDGSATDVSAAMNVRGLTGGPRGGALLFVGSSLLATSVFALLVAPPASKSCAARHYAASVLFAIAAVVVAVLRPHRAPLSAMLTVLILIFLCAATVAVGAVAGNLSAPYGPSAGLATAATILSLIRTVHAVILSRIAPAQDKDDVHRDENCQELALTVPDEETIVI